MCSVALRVGTLAAVGVTVLIGCGEGRKVSASAGGDTANERTLSHAQSLHLVHWATTYERCMATHGWSLGELAKAPTQLSMAVPGTAKVPALIADSITCGDLQGGPPVNASLQYRARKILLYLPKQCLLDPNVAAS